jgi:hypothetical protein
LWLACDRAIVIGMRGGALLLVLSGLLATAAARAETPSSDSASLAEALFREGKKLMREGNYAEACPKLAESQRLDPGAGTLVALALCYEAEGKTASGWVGFNEALATAVREGNADRKTVAETRLKALENQLSWLTIRVPPATAGIQGLELRRDGLAILPPAWGVATPVDPGAHAITASAPGRRSWRADVQIGANADVQEITVPELELELEPAASPLPAAPAPSLRAETRRAGAPEPRLSEPRGPTVWTAVAGGVGLVGIGAGTWLGISALRAAREADRRCPGPTCSDSRAVELSERATTLADLSTASFVTGAVGLGIAITLLLVPGDPPPKPKSSAALFSPLSAGWGELRGQW